MNHLNALRFRITDYFKISKSIPDKFRLNDTFLSITKNRILLFMGMPHIQAAILQQFF